MSDSKPAGKEGQEPSMEEILSSIRQIIASDEGSGEKAGTPAEESAAKAQSPEAEEEEVLELTEVVPAEEVPEKRPKTAAKQQAEETEPAPQPETAAAKEPEETAEPPEAETETEQPPPPAKPDLSTLERQADQELAERAADLELVDEGSADESEAELISEPAAEAATGAFAKLARSVARPEPEPLPAGDGKTVEQLVAELMRPMLKEWLDQNLPAIVERVVEREVRKLARRAELM